MISVEVLCRNDSNITHKNIIKSLWSVLSVFNTRVPCFTSLSYIYLHKINSVAMISAEVLCHNDN